MRKVCDLTTPITVQNITGFALDLVGGWDDDNSRAVIQFTPLAAGLVPFPSVQLIVQNGMSSKLARNASSTGIWDKLTLTSPVPAQVSIPAQGVSTPTGYDTLFAAWRAGANKNARNKALADTLLSLGVIDASLTGTTT